MIGRLCDVDARLNNVEDVEDGLVKRVDELKNELDMERDAQKTVEERLRIAEEKLKRATVTNGNGSDDGTPSPGVAGPEVPTKSAECVERAERALWAAGRRFTYLEVTINGKQKRRSQ